MKINFYNFNIMGDETGSLVALEANKNIPFEIKRVYYIFDTQKGVVRGKHAHRDLKQIVICVKGNCKILLDNGKEKEEIILNSPDKSIYIDGIIWREMYDFSDDCVLVVLANEYYDENEYIRDYKEFKKQIKE